MQVLNVSYNARQEARIVIGQGCTATRKLPRAHWPSICAALRLSVCTTFLYLNYKSPLDAELADVAPPNAGCVRRFPSALRCDAGALSGDKLWLEFGIGHYRFLVYTHEAAGWVRRS
jgi:hypothetical protein